MNHNSKESSGILLRPRSLVDSTIDGNFTLSFPTLLQVGFLYCWYLILSTLDLRAWPWKIQKYYFLSMGLREHLEWCGITRSNTRALKVPLLAKMTKMPLVNPGLTESQTKSKSSQNNFFHGFISNPIFLELFGNFDQVWPSRPGVDSW